MLFILIYYHVFYLMSTIFFKKLLKLFKCFPKLLFILLT
nr:MAG TPA_asm: hypothetical protein [Caudoviricetes sp.]